jgi:osmotically-inducible protein OsmY
VTAGVRRRSRARTSALVAAALAAALALSACVPAVVAVGVGAGVLVATDRRSASAQVDDEAIELKVVDTISTRWPDNVHVNATSFNGVVLLTGEVPTATVNDEIAASVKAVERVRSVVNEMVVGAPADLGARTNDSYITSKVKSGFVEANRFSATHVKVVTERSVVYLMGIVSREEGSAAGQLAASTTGVLRVVKVFEYTP